MAFPFLYSVTVQVAKKVLGETTPQFSLRPAKNVYILADVIQNPLLSDKSDAKREQMT